jgi:Nucleoside-diphosphate-sugar epimerases
VKPGLYSEIKNATVLITGGLGFIGQNLAKTLITDFNCTVRIVDDCSNSVQQVHLNFPGESELYTYSILDFDKYFSFLNEVEFIFHLACVQMSRSSEISFQDMNVNAGSTLGILEYLRNNRSGNFKKFIYSSSSSVYGNSKELPMNENTPVSILSQYAGSKLLGENYTILYNKKYGIPTTVLRLSNVYGLRQFASISVCGVIGKFIENAICGKSVSIYGNGEQTRDYTFIDDVIEAAILASVHPDSDGDIFNVSTNRETSVNEIISIMKGYFPKLIVHYLPERDIDCIRHRRIDNKKIKDKLGWEPRIYFEEGVKRTINCFKNYLFETALL